MALSYIIIICLVLAEAHMWILGDLDADLLQLWSCHLLFVSFGKYCITRNAKTAVPLNGRRDGLFSETDTPPPQFDPPSFLQLDPLLIILTNIHASWRMQSRGPSGWGLRHLSTPPFFDGDGFLEANWIKDAILSSWFQQFFSGL